jgi:hypothetical protein
MQYTDDEADLARKHMRGEYTETQFNYLVHQYGMDKKKMMDLMDYLNTSDPLSTAAKFIVLCMMLHFAMCFVYAVFCHINH